jgi:hypothetical protein
LLKAKHLDKLADLGNLTQAWAIDLKHIPNDPTLSLSLVRGFKNAKKDVPIELEALEREYCRLMNQPYPITEMVFVRSWMLFRVRFSFLLLSAPCDGLLTAFRVVGSYFPGYRSALCSSPGELGDCVHPNTHVPGRWEPG